MTKTLNSHLIASLKADIRKLVFEQTYPLGSIYISATCSTPESVTKALRGGAWQLDSVGKTIVGYSSNDKDFNQVDKTGGRKTHTHTTQNHTLTIQEMPKHGHNINLLRQGSTQAGAFEWNYNSTAGVNDYYVKETGGSQPHNHGDTGSASNLPPYQVFYIWRRIG